MSAPTLLPNYSSWPDKVKVAHWLGWTDIQNLGPRQSSGGQDEWVGIAPRHHKPDCDRYCVAGCPASEPRTYDRIPDYPNSWAACEAVVEEIKRQDWTLSLIVSGNLSRAKLIGDEVDEEPRVAISEWQAILPAAICAAFLAFMEGR